MRAAFNLPFNKIVKSLPIDFSIFKWCNQSRDGTVKHGFSFLFSMFRSGDTLSFPLFFGKNSPTVIAVFLIALNVLTVFPAAAKDSPVNRMQTKQARSLTIEALKDVRKNQWANAREKIAASRDPLASKIYYWLLLMDDRQSDVSSDLFMRLSRFIRQNPDWPSIDKVKVKAEGVMPERLSNAEVIAWYDDFSPKTSYGMGRYVDALIIEGKKTQARKFVADWWARTLVSREQQRQIFQKYGGYLTLEAHKKRFDALLFKKHYENARAIAAVLGQGYPELAEARIALAQNKGSGLQTLIGRVPVYLQDDAGLLYERLRWRRERDLDDGAIEILEKTPDASKISNPKEWWAERHIIIRRLLEKGQYRKAYDLAQQHVQKEGFSYAQAQWVTGWLALRFLDMPAQAYERFTALHQKVKTPVSKARAAYWSGRAAKALKQDDLAQSWFKKAAEFRTVFYGQLAGAELSQRNRLPKSNMPNLSQSDRKNFEKNELVQAADLFEMAGMKDRSKSFLNAFLRSDETPKAYRFAAEITAERGDMHNAVRIAKLATKKGLFLTKQSYPTITKQLQGINETEWALLHALIRQESIFDIEAKSRAGALGLMQLMPSTARSVAKKINVSYKKQWLTTRPKYNMRLGSAYIAELIARYDGEYALAIAAYNAGPGRVDSWVKTYGDPRKREIELIDWIELIPIYETRNYVQRVMESTYIYRLRLKNIQEQPQESLYISMNPRK